MNAGNEFSSRSPDLDGIERQNEQLREDMGRTIAALERKLSPGQLLDDTLQLAKEHGGAMAVTLGQTIKENPAPVVLTTIGVAWLVGSILRNSHREDTQSWEASTDYGDAYEGVGTGTESSRATGIRSRFARTRQHMRTKLDQAKSRLHSHGEHLGEQLGEQTSGLRERVRHRTESLRGSMSHAAEYGHDARVRAQSFYNEQPLVVGAAALAIGALLGALLPTTARENELLGETRDRALRRAKEIGEEQFDRARQAARRAVDGAMEGAQHAVSGAERPH